MNPTGPETANVPVAALVAGAAALALLFYIVNRVDQAFHKGMDAVDDLVDYVNRDKE